MRIPVSELRKAARARSGAAREVEGVVRLSVMVACGCPLELAREMRAGLRPARAGGRLHVEAFGGEGAPAANALSDAALVLVGGASPTLVVAELCRAYAQAGVPVAVGGLFGGADEAARVEAALVAEGVPESSLFMGLDPAQVADALGAWLVARLPEEAAAAASANFPCCRRARALSLVSDACGSNALVGLLGFVPGADLPVMTLTQVTLALRLAALYGLPLDRDRLREVAPVVAGAFGMRGLARSIASALPVPATLVRVGVGAGGTYAVGRALVAWFEGRLAGGEAARDPSGSEGVRR